MSLRKNTDAENRSMETIVSASTSNRFIEDERSSDASSKFVSQELQPTDNCSTLAFYEINHKAVSARRFYNLIYNLTITSMIPLSVGSIKWNRVKNGWKTITTVDKKIKKVGFGHITSMDLATIPPGTMNPLTDYYLYAHWSYKSNGNSSASITVQPSVRSFIDWNDLARKLVDILSPQYGIAYQRNCANGPIWFVSGIATYRKSTPEIDEEDRRTCGWSTGDHQKVFKHGMIRDVFEWNFLNKIQLDQPIGSLTFKEWIESSRERGTLTPISKDLTLWEVDMAQQPAIFQTLFDADIIYDRDRHMYWFHKGKKLTPAERIALKSERRKQEYDRLVEEWGPEKTEKWLDERGL